MVHISVIMPVITIDPVEAHVTVVQNAYALHVLCVMHPTVS